MNDKTQYKAEPIVEQLAAEHQIRMRTKDYKPTQLIVVI